MDDDLSEVIGEFLVESHENLDQLDSAFVDLERDPTSRTILASIFRTIHTIKGTTGFLGFNKLESLTHQGENLLALLRDGVLRLTPDMTSALLAMVDAVRGMLQEIEDNGHDGPNDFGDLKALLASLANAKSDPAIGTPGETPAEAPLLAVAEAVAAIQQVVADEVNDGDPAADKGAVNTTAAPEHAAAAPADVHDDHGQERRASMADNSIRVDVALLDRLMNLVGELVLTRNQLVQHIVALSADASIVSSTQRLNNITSELQEGVMKTRMQPIGTVWSKFPRVVRDLALMCGKQVRMEMEGKETELDKTIIEAIKDPLTHLVRNSVDHGIEAPEVRTARGKTAEGMLLLRAYHEGGQVNIEIIDDGGGIPPDKVRAKAIEKGLLTPEQAQRMPDSEVVGLIFQPGFSTAEKVTNVSGRGVGMDVVKTNIEKIGGSLDVQSKVGEGTTLKIKIPLTLAIIPALVVTAGDSRYAIPQVSLLELVRLEADQRHQVEQIGDAKLYRLRGNLIPVVELREVLGLGALPDPDPDTDIVDVNSGALNIVVLQAEGRQFGLIVESILDTEEIVVKPLGKHLQSIKVFAGTTIMGDGSVALILDVMGIAQAHRLASEHQEYVTSIAAADSDRRGDLTTLLVCSVGSTRVALPLALVARLEEFPVSTIEYAAGREVVQYRDGLMPLVRTDRYVGIGDSTPSDPMQVLVYNARGRSIGLVVDTIVDIVEEEVAESGNAQSYDSVEYSGVIGRRVTDFLNVDAIIERELPEYLDQTLSTVRS
ncbi:MAG: chemotaxis protein CheW [Acidimicrobiia bacterium]